MSVYRRWFCTCTGQQIELNYEGTLDDEGGEPVCDECGASPSSDPKRTILYHDEDDRED